MAHEIDGNGSVKIFTFTVTYSDGETTQKRFTDYADAWAWARQVGSEWEGVDAANTYSVDFDYEWIPEEDLEKCFNRSGIFPGSSITPYGA